MKSPKGFREIRTSSTPNLKQNDKLFEYFETPRFELDGGRRFAEHKRLSISGSDSNTKMSRNSSVKIKKYLNRFIKKKFIISIIFSSFRLKVQRCSLV